MVAVLLSICSSVLFQNSFDFWKLLNSLFSAGSGEIDFNEFLQLMAAKQANMTMEDELRNAFNVFDKDGSGYISAEELKQVMIINRSPSDGTFS